MRAGLRRSYITLERNFPTQGTSGETVDNWVVFGRAWAYMRAVVGDEEQAIYQLRIRYREMTHNDRFIYDSRIFNILSVLDKEGMRRDLWLEARELV